MRGDADQPTAARVLGDLLASRTGQQVLPSRSWRIESSLKAVLRELGLTTLDPLVVLLASGSNSALATKVVEALLNNETSFFRDSLAFEQLERDALEQLRRARAPARRLRIWSAACSTGQEAYSLAMMLRDAGPRWAGWTFEILATDISGATIARARAGRYSQFEIQRGLPVRTMLRWFRQEGDDWVIDPALRRDVRFAKHNLCDPAPGRFDLILCRNVLMYFSPAVRATVFCRIADALDTGGVVMLGAGETVLGQTERLVSNPDMRGLYTAALDLSHSLDRAAAR